MSLTAMELYNLEDDLTEIIERSILYDINDMTLNKGSVISTVRGIIMALDETIEMKIKETSDND